MKIDKKQKKNGKKKSKRNRKVKWCLSQQLSASWELSLDPVLLMTAADCSVC